LDWLENTFSQLPTHCDSFVIGGDFNIRAKELGSHKDDNGATRLVTLGLSLNPEGCILNDGSITRQHWITSEKNIQPSAIDVTMAYASTLSGIVYSNWKTNGSGLSDHMRITFDINLLGDTSHKNEMKRSNVYRQKNHENEENMCKARNRFAEHLSNLIKEKGWIPPNEMHPRNVPNVNPDVTIKQLNRMIIQAALTSELIQNSTPSRQFPLSQSRNFSWDEDCDCKLKNRRKCCRELAKARRVYLNSVEIAKRGRKRNHLGELVENEQNKEQLNVAKVEFVVAKSKFNKSITALKKAIKLAKETSWNSAISFVNADTPMQSLWQMVNKLGRKVSKRPARVRPFLVMDGNGEIQSQPKLQANCLAQYWEIVSKNNHTSYNQSHFDQISSSMNSLRHMFSPLIPSSINEAVSLISELPKNAKHKWQTRLTQEELQKALASINPKSKPGEDSLTYEMIKYGGEIF